MRKGKLFLLLAVGVFLCGCGQEGDAGEGNNKTTMSAEGREGENEGVSQGEGAEAAPGEAGEDTSAAADPGEGAGAAPGEAGEGGSMAADQGKGEEAASGEAGEGRSAAAGQGKGEEAAPGETGEGTSAAANQGEGVETASGGTGKGGNEDVNPEERVSTAAEGTEVVQGGPYGEVSLMLPAGWRYESCPMDSEKMVNGEYGIHFSPEGAEEGFIELACVEWFGVCGTELEQEDRIIAGAEARVGTYSGNPYWNFVYFMGQNEGVVAISCGVEGWWEEYGEAATEILDTLRFDPDTREGSTYVFTLEAESTDIGLNFSLKDISATGATLVYDQFDGSLPSGRLQDGDDFTLEQKTDGGWEAVPVAVEGEYGFHAIAYTIPNDQITRRELDWKWLYGELKPGRYRLGKKITDFRKTGDYDNYTLYGEFILN